MPASELAVRLPRVENMGIYEQRVAALHAALQAVERTTAECTRRAIELQCPTLYDCAAEKKVHIVAMDGASSCTKCEGAILEEAPPRVAESGHPVASLRTSCAVHRAQAVIKSTARLAPTTASGVLNMV